MLDDEVGFHLVGAAFLDGEWLAFEGLEGAWGGEVDGDVGAAFDFLVGGISLVGERCKAGLAYECERFDDAQAWVFGIADGLALAETEGCFPAVESLIVLVCW